MKLKIYFDKKKEGEAGGEKPVNIMEGAKNENANVVPASSGSNPVDLTPVITALDKGFSELGKILAPKSAEPAKKEEVVLPSPTTPPAPEPKKSARWFDEFDPGL